MIQRTKTPDWWRPFIGQLALIATKKELDATHDWDFMMCLFMLSKGAKYN